MCKLSIGPKIEANQVLHADSLLFAGEHKR